jgi:Heterokaryon incompatibility protein (HET)
VTQKSDRRDFAFQQGPLRCLRKQDGRFEIVPDTDDQNYMAISYGWPSDEFHRMDSSKEAVDIYQNGYSIQSSNFTRFMTDALAEYMDRDGLCLWLDYHCIDQENVQEKDMQIAGMSSIFSNAAFSAVMLEDVGMLTEEFEILKRPKNTNQRDRHLSIIRRVMSSRIFTRAWCSQESFLSRKATIFVHHTEKLTKPVAFGFGTLRSWVDLAFRSDASLPRLYQSMAIEGPLEGTFEVIKSFVWTYGILIHQKRFNIYDKISLTLNLLSVPANQHFIGLPVKSNRSDEDKLNVNRILNILAIQPNKNFFVASQSSRSTLSIAIFNRIHHCN